MQGLTILLVYLLGPVWDAWSLAEVLFLGLTV